MTVELALELLPEPYLTADALHVLSLLNRGDLSIWWDWEASEWSTGDELFAITPALRGHLDLLLLGGWIEPQQSRGTLQRVGLTDSGRAHLTS